MLSFIYSEVQIFVEDITYWNNDQLYPSLRDIGYVYITNWQKERQDTNFAKKSSSSDCWWDFYDSVRLAVPIRFTIYDF